MTNRSHKILTVGLTPARQCVMRFSRLKLGHVCRADKVTHLSSGKNLNVAAGVAVLAASSNIPIMSRLLTPWEEATCRNMEAEMAAIGVTVRTLPTIASTRLCTTLLVGREPVTELVENGLPLSEIELDRFVELFAEEQEQADLIVLTGSLPQDVPSDYYRRLLEQTDKPWIGDFHSAGLLAALEKRPLLVKPNLAELAATLPGADRNDHAFEAMRELCHRGASWVMVSDGPGEIRAVSETETHIIKPPRMAGDEIVNPIGCGDAMTAGIAVCLCQEKSMPEAITAGMNAAQRKIRSPLPRFTQ